MKFNVLYLIINLCVINYIGAFPNLKAIKEELSVCPLFCKKQINTMCNIQSDSCGLWFWESGFCTITNSSLSDAEKDKQFGLLLALGILQIDPQDEKLIKDIKLEMNKWNEDSKRNLDNANLGFTFQDLEQEFRARSTSTSSTDSADE